MMPIALIAFLGKPLGKFAFWAVLFLLIAGVVVGAWIAIVKHYEGVGIAQEKDRQHNADMDWLRGAQNIGKEAQAKAIALGAVLDKTKQDMDHAQSEIARLSSANDRRACWNLDAVRRLRNLGPQQPGRPGGAPAAGNAGASGARR